MARAKKVITKEDEAVESTIRPRYEIEAKLDAMKLRDEASKMQAIIIELLLDIREKG